MTIIIFFVQYGSLESFIKDKILKISKKKEAQRIRVG